MQTIYKKELSFYLNNPVGYIVVILFSVFANFLFIKDIFLIGSASMRPFFNFLPWLMIVFVPAISMRSMAEEKRTNTIETLLTLPVSETQIIFAKFLAILSLCGIGLLLTLALPVVLSIQSHLYLPEVFVGYLGVLCMAGAYGAIALFFSSQTKNQVVAFLSSVVVLFLFTVVASDVTASLLPRRVNDFLNVFSPVYHLQNFIKGVIDFRSLFFFVSITLAMLFFTVIDLGKRE